MSLILNMKTAQYVAFYLLAHTNAEHEWGVPHDFKDGDLLSDKTTGDT